MKSLLLGILFVLVALVVAAVVALAVVNLGVDRTATKSHTVFGEVREIVVKPGDGNVEFIPAGSFIRIRESQHYVLDKPKLERTRSAGVLTIASKCDVPDPLPCYSDMRITVPAGVKLTVDGGSGDVDLRAVELRSAHIESGSGDIEFGLAGNAGLLWARSGSGDIEFVTARARSIDARSQSGDVDVDAATKPRRLVARSSSGDVELTLPRGIYAVAAKSGSGDVEVRGILRNRKSASSVDARTDDGDIELRPR
jgi:hypothetical protein